MIISPTLSNKNQHVDSLIMDQPKHRVKLPCNHPLIRVYVAPSRPVDDEVSSPGSHSCGGCGLSNDWGFYCPTCNFGAHFDCIISPDVMNLPCHSRHPLKLVSTETIENTDGQCHFCRWALEDQTYHCSICSFSIHVPCSMDPPPLTIYQPKSHNHTFTLMARLISFTCNACGMVGDRNPYVCLECSFTLHGDCIDLPRVIDINRHEHRMYRTYDLNPGDWECGVCRKKMDGGFGAFSCKRCPNYGVHSKCATRSDVWDGKELEDEPEEEEAIEDPYEVINEKEIKHFSHRHNLGLVDDIITGYDNMWCDACLCLIDSDPFFKCEQCKFFLHKLCASLPRLKRNILHNHKLTLHVEYDKREYFECTYCLQFFGGFRYKCTSGDDCKSDVNFSLIDVRCSSISEPFHHELHPHPLYRTSTEDKTCGACGKVSEYVLSCIVCEFALGMECATLPRKVRHRCDDHVLSLHHDPEYPNGQLWCDICEGKTDPSVWFYGCDICGVALHIKCVIGDMYYLKPWDKYMYAQVLPNNGMCRPFCLVCDKRCMYPYLLVKAWGLRYACSMECARGSQRRKWLYGKAAPWHKNPPVSYFLKWRAI